MCNTICLFNIFITKYPGCRQTSLTTAAKQHLTKRKKQIKPSRGAWNSSARGFEFQNDYPEVHGNPGKWTDKHDPRRLDPKFGSNQIYSKSFENFSDFPIWWTLYSEKS